LNILIQHDVHTAHMTVSYADNWQYVAYRTWYM